MEEDTLAEGLGDRQAQMSERLSRGSSPRAGAGHPIRPIRVDE